MNCTMREAGRALTAGTKLDRADEFCGKNARIVHRTNDLSRSRCHAPFSAVAGKRRKHEAPAGEESICIKMILRRL
jgi:hypothetical protein